MQGKNENGRGRYALKSRWEENLNSNLWGILIVGVLLLVDMLTKILADVYFNMPDSPKAIEVIPGYLDFRISYNQGMAFSMGQDAPIEAKLALVIGTGMLFVVLFAFFLFADKRRTWLRLSLLFVVAGGIGNFIDRILYLADPNLLAGVRDMVRLKIWFMDFGVCNFADFFIVGGAVALILAILFFDSGAILPVGKYKALSKEMEEAEKAKKAAKKAQKAAEKQANTDK